METPQNCQRELYRTPAELTVHFGEDTPEGRQAMALDNEMWAQQSALESEARQAMSADSAPDSLKPLMAVMRWLDYKTDLVLYHLRSRELAGFFPHRARTADLSGTGLRMIGEIPYKVGDKLLLRLPLPDAPARPVMALGEIVRLSDDEAGKGKQAAVNFMEIPEDHRERIIRFTFDKQREMLAKRTEERQ